MGSSTATWASTSPRRAACARRIAGRARSSAGWRRLRVLRDEERWVFEIADDGPGFDWRRFLDFDPERAFAPNGRGIALSRQLSFSSLTYIPPGNVVIVTVPRVRAGGGAAR